MTKFVEVYEEVCKERDKLQEENARCIRTACKYNQKSL